MKINITFFMENEVFIISSYNNFFKESNIFWKNCEKNIWGYEHFLEDVVILWKN